KLGAGAMGQVFLARSTTGRLVAVKTVRVELAEEPGYRARFAREVAAASRVSGVFTASVIQADAEADLPWVATAYVPAPSLSTLVRRCGPLPVPAVRWLAAGCAEALQSIHSVGLVHRDVKPSNVLVAPNGPQVIDFGVARVAERVQLTATRGAAGTPAYMAPEQARDATLTSPASDVFSLGATLVFAATGHPPYRGDTVMDILVRLATEPPDLTGMPGELSDLVAACLERVPRDRPTDAAILTELGSFALPAGPGHSYLPDSAMALIAEYQHGPRLPSGTGTDPGDDDEDDDEDEGRVGSATDGSVALIANDATSGSHTALPGFAPAALRDWRRPPPGRRNWRRDPGLGPRTRSAPRSRRLAWAAAAAAGVLLLGAGVGAGMLLRGSTTAVTAPCSLTPSIDSAPQICVNQPIGDGYTEFVIHGVGFVPKEPVTVAIDGIPSPDRPTADKEGTFNYVVDQGHYFFHAKPIPTGVHEVVATAPDGLSADTSFQVYSYNAQPALTEVPSGGPPPGNGPPGSGAPPP
ncbi:MAG TPA: serine/threonine-protein kinase, partial [Trebonia sp.]|nr:serine/threonine-protein kinase [Trebonia sp.]